MPMRFRASCLGPLTAVLLIILGWWTGTAAPPPKEPDETLPLGRILVDMANTDLEGVRKAARMQAQAGKDIKYRSSKIESKIFEGCFIPGGIAPAGKRVALAIFSDDGCEVEVDGQKIHKQFGMPQHLPWVTEDDIPLKDRAANKAKISLYELKSPSPDGKAPWVEGRAYHIKVTYSNIIFVGNDDIDGCTLFAYQGGGGAFEIDPVSTSGAIATDPINRISNPSGIVILKDNLDEKNDPDQLALTEKNTAVVRITSPFSLAFSKEKFEWTIESVDKLTGDLIPKAEQRAAFLVLEKGKPPVKGQSKITAQDRVLVYGLKEGRVRITAALEKDKQCKEIYEAYVREQLNIPFRVQLLEGKTEGVGTNLIWEKKGAKFIRRTDDKALQSAEEHIRIANIYLRQVGVRLRPDTDKKIDPNGKIKAEIRLLDLTKPGFLVLR